MTTRRIWVEGRVQGVYYRASTRTQAQHLGLVGWVRNLSDGRVELLAQGDDMAVDKLEAWCHKGPPHARVDKVETRDEAARDGLEGFEILKTADADPPSL